MSEQHRDTSVFGDEDNSPFPHQLGLASLIQSQGPDKKMSNSSKDNVDNELDADQNDKDIDDESMLLYRSDREQFNTVHINYESRVTKLLGPESNAKIVISETGKSNEGMADLLKKYVVYTIKLVNQDNSKEEIQTRRRYSDFESLRDVLTRVYPLLLIPPIPPKNYFSFNVFNGLVSNVNGGNSHTSHQPGSPSDSPTESNQGTSYTYINSKHLNKNKLVEHRKRLLSNFLNNCLQIPQVRNLEFFAKFLDPSANWSDEIELISSQLPKSIYQLNPENGLKTDEIYASLPLPPTQHGLTYQLLKPLKSKKKFITQTTSRFLNSGNSNPETTEETTLNRSSNETEATYENHDLKLIKFKTSSLDNINKKIMESFIGLSNDYVELGSALNSFSLMLADSLKDRAGKNIDEDDVKLDLIADKIGVAFDRSYIAINALVSELETKFSEPLGEAVQYDAILGSVNKFQARKSKQRDVIDQELYEKRKELTELQKNSHINGENGSIPRPVSSNDADQANNIRSDASKAEKLAMFLGMGSLKRITKYVSDIIDQNPEETKRNRIAYLQKKITTLEKCQTIMLQDISFIANELELNTKMFKNRELKTIFQILLNYNSILMSWAKKTLYIWEEIKEEIEAL